MIYLIFNIYNILVVVIGGIVTCWCYGKYKQTHSRPLLNCLPGVFTSLGLLGTFISICVSLYGLEDISPDTMDNIGKTIGEVKAARSQELDVMKIISELIPAFTSSIVGLVCALVATVWIKMVFAGEEEIENYKMRGMSPEDYIQEIASNTKGLENNEKLLGVNNGLLDNLIELHKQQDEKNRKYNEVI